MVEAVVEAAAVAAAVAGPAQSVLCYTRCSRRSPSPSVLPFLPLPSVAYSLFCRAHVRLPLSTIEPSSSFPFSFPLAPQTCFSVSSSSSLSHAPCTRALSLFLLPPFLPRSFHLSLIPSLGSSSLCSSVTLNPPPTPTALPFRPLSLHLSSSFFLRLSFFSFHFRLFFFFFTAVLVPLAAKDSR